MSYLRVIPRDLFNEANLLKCYGKLYIALENLNAHSAELIHTGERDYFNVQQDYSDGSLFVQNIALVVRGETVRLRRPLNSRDEWPLYAWTQDDDIISVFNENGMFSAEMLAFLTRPGC